jgi:hypothetical protein
MIWSDKVGDREDEQGMEDKRETARPDRIFILDRHSKGTVLTSVACTPG